MQMVWCNSCSTVVWAYDHQPPCNLSGIINMMALPCPNCNRQRTFNGWGANNLDDFAEIPEVVDDWMAMKAVAKQYNLHWNPSPDNQWMIGAYEGLRNRIDLWKREKHETSDELVQANLQGRIDAYKWLLGEN